MFKLGDIRIGDKFKLLIISEFWINHKDSLKIVKKMFNIAYKFGTEAIKISLNKTIY